MIVTAIPHAGRGARGGVAGAGRPAVAGALVAARGAREVRQRRRLDDGAALRARPRAARRLAPGGQRGGAAGGRGRRSWRGRRSRRCCTQRHGGGAAGAGGRGHDGHDRAAPARPPDGALRLVHAAARGAQGARRRARRAREGGAREARAGVLGLGRAGGGAVAARARRRTSCATSSASPARSWTGRSRSRTCGCASRRSTRRCAAGSRRSPATSAPTARRACCAAAASPTSTCSPSAPATARTRPTRSWRRPTTTRCSPCCRRATRPGVAVVPFGGGTSVVGGLEPLRGPFGALISLDLGADGRAARRRRALAHRDARARAAAAGGRPRARRPRAHARARAAELRVGDGRRLRRHPLGRPGLDRARPDRREPRSPCASRPRSATLATRDAPASAAGPELRQLVAGSEGVLGVITAATLRVHRLPEAQRFEGWLLAGFEAGCDALRRLEQAGAGARRGPAVRRGRDALHARAGRRRPDRARGVSGEPLPADPRLGRPVTPARDRCGSCAAPGRASPRASPGERWAHSRFDGPHLRDDLLDRGVMVETLETATTWSNLTALHGAVRAALPGLLVGCHVSHLYPTGASLYFTVLGRRSDDPAAQWRALKAAATDAIVGRRRHDHAPPRGRPRSRRRGWAPRWGSSGWACCARSRTAATRRGS